MLVFSCFYLQGQEQEAVEENPHYREDQIYFGASFMLLNSNQQEFKPQGLSRHFQWGLVRDIPLSKSGRFATGVGLGMAFERYTTNLIPLGQGKYTLSNSDSVIADPLFFSVQSLELPLSIRWRSSTPYDYAFWRIYGGVSFQWHYRLRAKQNGDFLDLKDELEVFGTTAHLSFGYNTWNFYVAYRLTPFLNTKTEVPNALPIQLTPIKIGLIFYLL